MGEENVDELPLYIAQKHFCKRKKTPIYLVTKAGLADPRLKHPK